MIRIYGFLTREDKQILTAQSNKRIEHLALMIDNHKQIISENEYLKINWLLLNLPHNEKVSKDFKEEFKEKAPKLINCIRNKTNFLPDE